MITFVDTHAHLDGEEFNADRPQVIERARQAGCKAILLPAIDLASSKRILQLCKQYPGYLYPMIGLHPEEVRYDWRDQLKEISNLRSLLDLRSLATSGTQESSNLIAIGEVGLDYYWSRQYEKEQLEALDIQLQWSVETRLPLMIHCRKAQNELVHLLKHYEGQLPGGVFHCFSGNGKEAAELLQFEGFALGIGGVLTFKKSHLPEVLPQAVPLDRLVLETDAPYMAPVPNRGKRNESAYLRDVVSCLAQAYGVSETQVADNTTANVERIFGINFKEN